MCNEKKRIDNDTSRSTTEPLKLRIELLEKKF